MTIFAGIISSNAFLQTGRKAELEKVFLTHINSHQSLKFESDQQLFLGYNANNNKVSSFSQDIAKNLSWVSGKAILKGATDNEAEQLLPQWLENNLSNNLKQSRGVFFWCMHRCPTSESYSFHRQTWSATYLYLSL